MPNFVGLHSGTGLDGLKLFTKSAKSVTSQSVAGGELLNPIYHVATKGLQPTLRHLVLSGHGA
jgi:hypothetical protein